MAKQKNETNEVEHDEQTGEVSEAENAKELARIESEVKVATAFEQAKALLAQAAKLDADDFDTADEEFVKFEKPRSADGKTPGDTVQGVYLGEINDRLKMFAIGMLGKDKEPIIKRILSTRQLSSIFSRLVPNKHLVRIEYLGKEKTGSGRNVKKFDVGTKLIATAK